jgi:hypothetical protein
MGMTDHDASVQDTADDIITGHLETTSQAHKLQRIRRRTDEDPISKAVLYIKGACKYIK